MIKSPNTVRNWEKRQSDKQRRIRLLGWMFLLLALSCSGFAYAVQQEIFGEAYTLTADETEGYYMMSLVFAVMGLFCLNAVKRKSGATQ